ncbi:UNVERIFIED_CONTAM: Dynamin-related protein 4C [Sesamum calycinum]|uniref:Dynamin-related protein 4C n=1 Tax=Sesamum calycinum TaxID=2727403 RepID=A0AAW2LYM3_9LAMI
MENDDTINGSSEATPVSEAAGSQQPTRHADGGGGQEDANAGHGDQPREPEPSDRRKEILQALAAVERDSAAIAESFSSLFASLRLSLSQATSSTVDHMNCFSDAAGRLQECVLDASTKGNRYINSCLRIFVMLSFSTRKSSTALAGGVSLPLAYARNTKMDGGGRSSRSKRKAGLLKPENEEIPCHQKILKKASSCPPLWWLATSRLASPVFSSPLQGLACREAKAFVQEFLSMRLQNHHNSQPEIFLEYAGAIVPTDEQHIADAITAATDAIAGKGKGISNNPLTLIVKMKGVPDLTMVDLPGITRVPVPGQPEDIYEQISKIIMEFIAQEESIILNVLSATVDFSTCESIRMSQRVDKIGQRTLAVVTKADKSPEGLLEKVSGDDVYIGLGYVCVRNRIGDESYEQARVEEARLFENHSLLSRINKSMVGIPVLAQKLVQIQAMIIVKCLPDIVRKINHKLSANVDDLNSLPQNLTSVSEALASFMHVLVLVKNP